MQTLPPQGGDPRQGPFWVLRAKGIRADDFDRFVGEIMEQAEALFGDWPIAA